MTLAERFDALPRPSRQDCFSLESGDERIRVGRSFEGHPVLLFSFAQDGTGGAARRLANIAYAPPMHVEVVASDGARRVERLAILRCIALDRALREYFFRVADLVLFREGATVTEPEFDAAFDSLVSLFSALQQPARRSLQGLWGELAIIAWSTTCTDAISAWHSGPRALHDFSGDHFRLEVKSTTRPLREHSFILDQLTSLPHGETLIASVMLSEKTSGASVNDLVELISRREGVGTEQVLRVQSIVAESLGAGWEDADELRFDLDAARQTFMVFSVASIPSVPSPLPPQVKDVRFVADLSSCPPLGLPQARQRSQFFAALLPDA